MQNRYTSAVFFTAMTWLSLMLLAWSVQAGPARLAPRGRMIRIAGKLVERASQRPLSHAIIMVKCGEMVLANRQSNQQGEFVLYIPPEKISQQELSIKIKYHNHIFIEDRLEPTSQEMLIEINGAVLFESHPIEDYQMPIHPLVQPEVGRVLIRTRNYQPERPMRVVRSRR